MHNYLINYFPIQTICLWDISTAAKVKYLDSLITAANVQDQTNFPNAFPSLQEAKTHDAKTIYTGHSAVVEVCVVCVCVCVA